MQRRISKLFRWSNLVIIILTFFSYLSPYINPEAFWPITFFGMAYPWLLLANVLFVVGWLLKKDRYFLFSLVCILLGWNHLTSFVGLHRPEAANPEKTITVMTYNFQRGYGFEEGKKLNQIENKELHALFSGNNENSFLCFQEIGSIPFREFSEQKIYPYTHKIRHASTAIFSHHPFLDKGGGRFEGSSNSYLWADAEVAGQRFRIFNIHLQSNKVSGVTDKVLQEGQLQEKETWRDIRFVIARIKRATQARSQQAKVIAEKIAASPYPVIVCGDFNDTPQSFGYHQVSRGLKDTFREKGLGFGTTYAGGIPALRIDYILSDPAFRILDNYIPRVAFSDHYPVISRIALEEK